MKKTKVLILISLTILFVSCSNEKKHSNISSIYVLFYTYSFESRFSRNCDDIQKDFLKKENKYLSQNNFFKQGEVLDTIISDINVLSDIEHELSILKKDSISFNVDVRICCIINYKNKQTKKLNIGGYLANDVEYKDINCKTNNKLLFLIKKNIGYYSWLGDNVMRNQNELKDSSFKRDSVIDYFGKKW